MSLEKDNIVGHKFRCTKEFHTHLGDRTIFEIGIIIKILQKGRSTTNDYYAIKIIKTNNGKLDQEYNSAIRCEELDNFIKDMTRVREIAKSFL